MSLLLHVQMQLKQHLMSSRAGHTFQFVIDFRNSPFQKWDLRIGLEWLLLVGTSLSVVYQLGDSAFEMQEMPGHLGSLGNYFLLDCAPLCSTSPGSRWTEA